MPAMGGITTAGFVAALVTVSSSSPGSTDESLERMTGGLMILGLPLLLGVLSLGLLGSGVLLGGIFVQLMNKFNKRLSWSTYENLTANVTN